MDFTPDFGWYYVSTDDRAPAWTSVAFFYDFITEQPAFASENAGIGPFGREVRARELEVGDLWPAFPAPHCTVGQLLSHQVGLAALAEPAPLGDLEQCRAVIERSTPLW